MLRLWWWRIEITEKGVCVCVKRATTLSITLGFRSSSPCQYHLACLREVGEASRVKPPYTILHYYSFNRKLCDPVNVTIETWHAYERDKGCHEKQRVNEPMSVCVHICICVYVYVYEYVYVYMYMYMYICIWICICIYDVYMYVSMCMYICMYVYMYVSMYMYVCVYVCEYLYVYMYVCV